MPSSINGDRNYHSLCPSCQFQRSTLELTEFTGPTSGAFGKHEHRNALPDIVHPFENSLDRGPGALPINVDTIHGSDPEVQNGYLLQLCFSNESCPDTKSCNHCRDIEHALVIRNKTDRSAVLWYPVTSVYLHADIERPENDSRNIRPVETQPSFCSIACPEQSHNSSGKHAYEYRKKKRGNHHNNSQSQMDILHSIPPR